MSDTSTQELNSVLVDALTIKKTAPVKPMFSWKFIIISACATIAFATIVYLIIKLVKKNDSASTLPDDYHNNSHKVGPKSSLSSSDGPTVILSNPFMAAGSNAITYVGDSSTIINNYNAGSVSWLMNFMWIQFFVGSPNYWSSGFYSNPQSSLPTYDSTKIALNVNPTICKQQIPDWKVIAMSSQSSQLSTITTCMQVRNNNNGDSINTQICRPAVPTTGYVQLGDFISSSNSSLLNTTFAYIPLFWTLQGSQSTSAAYGGKEGSMQTAQLCITLPIEDSGSTVPRTSPVASYVTSQVTPYQGWIGPCRTVAGFPANSTTQYNLMTRYARSGDITTATALLEVNDTGITLSSIMTAYNLTQNDIPYLQAINNSYQSSYLNGMSLVSILASLDKSIAVGNQLLVAPLPAGYTAP